jgi:hypothetical protein
MPEKLPQAGRSRFTRLQQAQADAALLEVLAEAADPAPMAEIRCRSRLPLVELPEKLV